MSEMMRIRLECTAFGDDVHVLELDGEEAISQLFDHRMTVVVGGGVDARPEEVIGERATLWLEVRNDERWEVARQIHGLLCECEDVSSREREHHSYRVRLVPHLWLTTLVETLDLFLDMSVPDIIRGKLSLLDFSEGTDFELRIDEGAYPQRSLISQYKETDLSFLSRLCEHEGISFFFEHRDGHDVVIFADDNVAFEPLETEPLEYADRHEEPGVYELHARAKLTPRLFVQRDYNYRNPGVDLTASAQSDGGYGGGIVEYGGHFKTEEEGQRLARVRSEERTCEHKVIAGRASVPHLGAGTTFTLQSHPRGAMRLRVTRSKLRGRQPQMAAGTADGEVFVCRFDALDHDVPFRPARIVPKPRVGGMVTGIIDGPEVGAYAHLDDQGRYKVRFMFDTSGRGEGKASRPVRMMQPHSGAGYGMHFPLRVGTEVLVTFLDGDPDRPIIAGTVPNPQTPSPVVAENGRKNVIRTGGANEIDIDDTEDEQRVKISTPYGQSVLQIGAPNAAESGAFVGTLNNATTAAGGTTNSLTTFQNNWNTFTDTWAVHNISFAGPTTPLAQVQFGIDTFRGLATTVSDITGSIMSVQDAIIQTKQNELESAQADLSESAEALDALEHTRRPLAVAVDGCVAATHPGLSPEAQAKLDALGQTKQAYDTAVAKLETDLAARDQLVADQGEAEAASKTTTAAGFQPGIDTYNNETLPADRTDIGAKRTALDAAATAAASDPELLQTSCGETLTGFNTTNSAYTTRRQLMDAQRQQVESVEREIATTESNQSDSREDLEKVQETADAVGGAISGFTAPLFSLVTSLWGTGMGGYTRNVADFMLVDTGNQALAMGPIIEPPSYGWAAAPPFMATKPPELGGAHTNARYGLISREHWHVDMLRDTKMLPTGGSGLLGFGMGKLGLLAVIPFVGPLLAYKFQKGAFAESRNIVGSEVHSVMFGMKSAFVHGTEHVTVSSAKNAVVTADKRVAIHARGTAEVAGGDVLLSAANKVDVEARKEFIVTATGPMNGGTFQDYGVTSHLDKKRSVLSMKGGKASMTAFDNMGTQALATVALTGDDAAPTGKIEINTGADNALTIEQGAAPAANIIEATTAGKVSVNGDEEIQLSSGESSITLDPQGISLKAGAQAELSVKPDELVMKLGSSVSVRLAQDKVVVAWGPTQVVLRSSALELKGTVIKHD